MVMADRSDEFRKAAQECLQIAGRTTDASARVALLTMAQKWFDLANGSVRDDRFDAALRHFNDQQMSGTKVAPQSPAMQQQQQVQPKKKD
jgi:hypothetical protein